MKQRWEELPESGGWFAIWLIRSIALHLGRRAARACLVPITLYFFVRRPSARSASRKFLSRMLGRRATSLEVMKHLHRFAMTILDRVWLLATGGRGFDIETEGTELLDARIAEGRGVLLVGSHFGSFEVLRALSATQPVPLKLVLDKQQTPALTALLEQLAPDVGRNVIDASQGGCAAVLALAEAAARGEMIAMLADRARPGERNVRVPFLDAPAAFPAGPWLLASRIGVPVVLCFGLCLGPDRYRVIFEDFGDQVEIDRQDREHALTFVVSAYAARLAHHVRLAPYNWFNLYDFWNETDAEPRANPRLGVGRRADA